MTSIGYIESFAAPLDRARRATFRWAAAFPRLRAILYQRDRRIALQASVGVGVAFLLAVVAPVGVMSISPALLGVPHVASDIRYLVVRQQLARWWLFAIAGGCAALLALRIADELAGGSLALGRVELGLAACWIAVAAVAGAAVSGAWRRLPIALPVIGVLGVFGVANPATTRLVFAHLHNIVALALWAYLFRKRLRVALVPLALVAAAGVVLVSGVTASVTAHIGGDAAFGLDLTQVAGWMAPGLASKLAVGVTLSFIFLQGIHYAVWLGWIPQEQLPGQSTMSFKSSIRSLVRDFGVAGFWVVVVAMVVVLAGSLASLHGARNLYLSLAVFHGYLELAMLCYFVVARRART